MENVCIRTACEADAAAVLECIRGIAAYENMSDLVENTVERIQRVVFREKAACVILAEKDGAPIGFALYFFNYSTFTGKKGLYLEDLFVKEAYRGLGIGKKLFLTLKEIAVAEDCGRMEWCCLKWNEPSIAFYRSMGAIPLTEWDTWRISCPQTKSE